MTDLAMKTLGAVRTKRPRATLADQDTVRIYNHSPGYIAVQLRSERSYSNVILTTDEAQRLAVMLVAVTNSKT
jgi:hypothetical protein